MFNPYFSPQDPEEVTRVSNLLIENIIELKKVEEIDFIERFEIKNLRDKIQVLQDKVQALKNERKYPEKKRSQLEAERADLYKQYYAAGGL